MVFILSVELTASMMSVPSVTITAFVPTLIQCAVPRWVANSEKKKQQENLTYVHWLLWQPEYNHYRSFKLWWTKLVVSIYSMIYANSACVYYYVYQYCYYNKGIFLIFYYNTIIIILFYHSKTVPWLSPLHKEGSKLCFIYLLIYDYFYLKCKRS